MPQLPQGLHCLNYELAASILCNTIPDGQKKKHEFPLIDGDETWAITVNCIIDS